MTYAETGHYDGDGHYDAARAEAEAAILTREWQSSLYGVQGIDAATDEPAKPRTLPADYYDLYIASHTELESDYRAGRLQETEYLERRAVIKQALTMQIITAHMIMGISNED